MARRHRAEAEEPALRSRPQGTGARPQTAGTAVLRQVDSRGDLSFAGASSEWGLCLRLTWRNGHALLPAVPRLDPT